MYYLDNSSTTCVSNEVIDEMYKYIKTCYGNPSSIHDKGQEASKVIEHARSIVAKSINCDKEEIIFTSSGSESNNLAIKGYCNKHNCSVITSKIEHKSVLKSCESLGCNRSYYVGVDECGFVNIEELEYYLNFLSSCYKENVLVSIQMANSEIGTIQDIKNISRLVHSYGYVLHVDAVQAYGLVDIDVKELGIDMMSVSGHKINAPKGIGFLYKKHEIELKPLIDGGNQEFGLRAGTENVTYIIGFAKAVELLKYKDIKSISDKRDFFIKRLLENSDCKLNGTIGDNRLPNNINVSYKNIDGESLAMLLNKNGIYVSNGSACNSGSLEQSYVLKSVGVDDCYIDGTVRITINNSISYNDINLIINDIENSIEKLKIIFN